MENVNHANLPNLSLKKSEFLSKNMKNVNHIYTGTTILTSVVLKILNRM